MLLASFSCVFLFIALKISLARLLTSAMFWLINASIVFRTYFPLQFLAPSLKTEVFGIKK